MGEILKPAKGEAFVFSAKYVDEAEGKYGPQLKLKDAASRILYVPVAANTVLESIGAITRSAEGYRGTGTAFQVFNPEKGPYRFGRPGDNLMAPASTQVAGSIAPRSSGVQSGQHPQPKDLSELGRLYEGCVVYARQAYGKEWDELGGDAMAASVATLFIAARHAGVTTVSQFDDPPDMSEDPPLPF